VARRLRADARCRETSIIAVTALAMVGDREKLMSAGFDGYISKPIDPESFPKKVQEFLPQPAARTQTRASQGSSGVATGAPPPPSKRGIFLFVDNSSTNLQLARSILEPQGYEVLTAASVEEGIKLARSRRPNMIVSDIHMPQHDGYYFLDLVHGDSELRHIPFVFLSASMQSERERSFAQSRGATKLLLRPIDPETLLGELEDCLPRAEP
jgi:two-component system cell cycle response regulator